MTAIYAGSFDPLTYGHIDTAERAAALFDHLVIGVLDNKQKKPLFSLEERVSMLREAFASCPGIEVKTFEGFAVDFAKANDAKVMVRGLRNEEDFGYELKLAQINRQLDPYADTVFIPTALEYSLVSSSAAKEIAMFGGDLSKFVPPFIEAKLREKYRR